MFVTEHIIETTKEDPYQGIYDLSIEVHNHISQEGQNEYYDLRIADIKEAILFISIAVQTYNLANLGLNYDFFINENKDPEGIEGFISDIIDIVSKELESQALEIKSSRFRELLENRFLYEFTEGDLKRIQTLINELRENIKDSSHLDNEHRARLLRRLERVQSELHKKVSDLDRFWGLIGDAGVIFGKLGKDAKPLIDRIKEISEITWSTQSRAEELPHDSKIPLLSNDTSED